MLASFIVPPAIPGEDIIPALIVQTIDVDERKRNALELAERESRWNHALESCRPGRLGPTILRVATSSTPGQWRTIRGLQPSDPIDGSHGQLDPVGASRRPGACTGGNRKTGNRPGHVQRVFSYRERHKNGHWVWIESRARRRRIRSGRQTEPYCPVPIQTSPSARRRKNASHRCPVAWKLALDISRIGVFEVNLRTSDVRWDDRMIGMYGLSGEPDSETWERALHPDDRRKATTKVADGIFRGQDFANEFRIIRGDGEIRHIRGRSAPYVDLTGVPRLIGANWDVTADVRLQEELKHAKELAEARNDELEAARARIEYTALHDHLTALPNRRYVDAKIEDSSNGGARDRQSPRRAAYRPRPLQGNQRHARPPCRRPDARARRWCPQRLERPRRIRRAHRRRRIHLPVNRHRRPQPRLACQKRSSRRCASPSPSTAISAASAPASASPASRVRRSTPSSSSSMQT